MTLAYGEEEHAIAVKERYEAQLLLMPSVIGVGIGAVENQPRNAAIIVFKASGQSDSTIPTFLEGIPVKTVTLEGIHAAVSCQHQLD